MKKWLSIVLTLTLVLTSAVVGATTNEHETVTYPETYSFDDFETKMRLADENPVADAFIEKLSHFSMMTAAKALSATDENVSFSPISLHFALALAATGADGETKEQLLSFLKQEDTDDFAKQNGNLFRRLYTEDEIGRLKIANSLWLAESFEGEDVHFVPDFIEIAQDEFYTDTFRVNFKAIETGEKIGQWIALHTNDQLTPEIETSDEEILSLVNTIDFYDEWIDRFDRSGTKAAPFYLRSGDQVEAMYMHEKTQAAYSVGDNYARASRQLKHNKMVFVLPQEGVPIEDLLKDEATLEETLLGGKDAFGDIIWQIPKFDFSSDLNLTDIVKNAGAGAIFDQDADFSKMLDHQAFVSGIQQQSRLAIDENGVSAAAFTQIDYAGAAPASTPLEMILDRPFIFAIYGPLETLLFVGIVQNPAA